MTDHHDDLTPAAAPGQPAPPDGGPRPGPTPRGSVSPWAAAAGVAVIAGALWLGATIGARGAHEAEGAPGEPAAGDAHAPHYYTCGMHPWVVLPKPGPCPICGMPLVPLDPAKFTGEVTIDPVVVQNIGVRLAPVARGPVARTIRTVGTVDYDETRVRDVTVKVAGWVQKLHVDALGQPVRRGDPLFELYSPELFAAQQEYLLALKGGALGGAALLEAARTKLRFLDVPQAEVAALERRGTPSKTLTLRSPFTGVVTEKKGFEGMKVDPGMVIFRVADLSKVWVMVTLYEDQLPLVRVGQEATLSLAALPGETLRGKVVYVYPYLDARARQARVRVEFDNPGLALKPGMYATVALTGREAGDHTLVPREAVIDTGERKVAFVSKGGGRFEPRQVRTGLEADGGLVEILDGLAPGEQVVTSGQFLLDSEARVREALAKMIGAHLAVAPTGAAAAGPAPIAAIPPPGPAGRAGAVDAWLAIGHALAAEQLAPVRARAEAAAAALDRAATVAVPGHPHFWHEQGAAALASATRDVAAAGTLDEARARFIRVGDGAARLLRATGVPAGVGPVEALHCPMAGDAKAGATWLQPPGEVRNPYLGKDMLACFDARRALPSALGDAR